MVFEGIGIKTQILFICFSTAYSSGLLWTQY